MTLWLTPQSKVRGFIIVRFHLYLILPSITKIGFTDEFTCECLGWAVLHAPAFSDQTM